MTDSTEAPPNARFIDLGGGTTAELMSNHIQFFYDPTTQASRAIFNGSQYLNIGGTYRALDALYDQLEVVFTNQMTRRYANEMPVPILDPVTGADLKNVSVAGIMILIKIAYDIEINARETQRRAAIALAAAKAAYANAQALAATAIPSPSPDGTVCQFDISVSHLAVTCMDTSTFSGGITATSIQWIFGDEVGSSQAADPLYTYAAPGTYTITLIITDSTGAIVKNQETVNVAA